MTAVTVTAEHIAKGGRRDPESCAIALALRDAFPSANYIAVSGEGITLQPCTDDPYAAEVEITPPSEVTAFVKTFDGDLHVEPFTFELDYPAVTR